VLALLEAAATTQPSGKQNTFAAHNLPDVVLVEVREKNLPVSYANAFVRPARHTHNHTLMEDAAAKLGDYMTRIGAVYDLETLDKRALVATLDVALPGAKDVNSLPELKAWLSDHLPGA
jgi:CRISPR system Cascade subunit CasC